jgi:hypothetical protein
MPTKIERRPMIASRRPLVAIGIAWFSACSAATAQPALGGRPYSWDSLGVLPLSAERPLTKEERRILDDIDAHELGRAETRAWALLRSKEDPFVAAWVIVQVARVTNRVPQLRARLGPFGRKKPTSPTELYLRYQACRLSLERTPGLMGGRTNPEFLRLREELARTRDLCAPFAKRHLPVMVALAQNLHTPIPTTRKLAEDYRAAHPKAPDIRSFLCRVYLVGRINLALSQKNRRPTLTGDDLQEPDPHRMIEICQEILRDDPKSGPGHYYMGRAFYLLGKDEDALREFKIVADEAKCPEPFRLAAQRFIARPDNRAFISKAIE